MFPTEAVQVSPTTAFVGTHGSSSTETTDSEAVTTSFVSSSTNTNCIMSKIGAPFNSEVSFDGSTATYTCHTGYTLVSSVSRTCDSGNWSSTVPTCESKLLSWSVFVSHISLDA